MALPTNFKRPAIPYVPVQVLANYDRYAALQGKPPTASQLDGDCNALMDYINQLAAAINETAAGIFPGADDPTNANKLPTTDGEGNVSWTQVTSTHLADQAVQTRHLSNSAVTREKIQVNAIGTNQVDNSAVTGAKIAEETIESRHLAANAVGNEELANNAVTTAKMADQAVTTAKLASQAVTTDKLPNNVITSDKIAANAVTGVKVADQSLPPSKIQSGTAPVQSVLTVTSLGNSAFAALPVMGKILQIQSTVLRTQSSVNGATTFTEFSTPLSVTLTTRAANSTILVFVSANLVGGYRANSHLNYPQTVYYALYKNGALWPAASGTRGTNQISGLGQVRSETYTHVTNISALASETLPTSNTRVTYSLRAYHASGAEYYVMLNSQLPDDGSGNYSGIASISSLYAIEIGG